MSVFWIQLISALVGTLGFAMLFKVRPRHFFLATVLGGCCFSMYYLIEQVVKADSFVASLCATILVGILAEVCARIVRTPALVFLLPGLIPIVPGSALYHAMKQLIIRDGWGALSYGMTAVKIAAGIAGGIIAVSVLMNLYMGIFEYVQKKKGQGTKAP